MTREEAKKIIHRHVMLFSSMPDDVLEAIQTLEQESCGDVISRQSTLKPYKGLKDDDVIAVWLIRKNIEQQPSVNQEPKTGHWIDHDKHIECDKCRTWFLKDYLIRKSFCPNCGCRMVEPQESEDEEV